MARILQVFCFVSHVFGPECVNIVLYCTKFPHERSKHSSPREILLIFLSLFVRVIGGKAPKPPEGKPKMFLFVRPAAGY